MRSGDLRLFSANDFCKWYIHWNFVNNSENYLAVNYIANIAVCELCKFYSR